MPNKYLKKDGTMETAVEFCDQVQRGRAGALLEAIHYDRPELRYGQIFFNVMREANRTVEPTGQLNSITTRPLIMDTFLLQDRQLYNILLDHAKTLNIKAL